MGSSLLKYVTTQRKHIHHDHSVEAAFLALNNASEEKHAMFAALFTPSRCRSLLKTTIYLRQRLLRCSTRSTKEVRTPIQHRTRVAVRGYRPIADLMVFSHGHDPQVNYICTSRVNTTTRSHECIQGLIHAILEDPRPMKSTDGHCFRLTPCVQRWAYGLVTSLAY